MTMMNKYKVIALVGKAGSGKDTVATNLVKQYSKEYCSIVSYTTRPPREGEINGVNYYFVNDKEFLNLVDKGEMLEFTQFNGWYYGTAITSLKNDKINVGVFNPAGIYSLMNKDNINLTVWYIQASDKERLLRQLNRENNPNVKEIIRRFQTDEDDFKDFFSWNYGAKNEELKDVQKTVSIIHLSASPKLDMDNID